MPRSNAVVSLIEVLEKTHKPFEPPARGIYQLMLWENVGYLVDDARRLETWNALKKDVGLAPKDILIADGKRLTAAISHGGMLPAHRAEKLLECARIAEEVGVKKLDAWAAEGGPAARKVLKRFPGMGDPGVDKMLMQAGSLKTVAPESNGLRVLTRVGLVKEAKSYSASYKAAHAALEKDLPDDAEWLTQAHAQLRIHGQTLCKRSAPLCEACPAAKQCAYP